MSSKVPVREGLSRPLHHISSRNQQANWMLWDERDYREAVQAKQSKDRDLYWYQQKETWGIRPSEDQRNMWRITFLHLVRQTAPITEQVSTNVSCLLDLRWPNTHCGYCLWALGIRTNLSTSKLDSKEHQQRTIRCVWVRKSWLFFGKGCD